MARTSLLLATLLLQVVVGEDLYWIPNTNWDNPSNWKLNRPPCGGEVASFASVPDNSVIYLNSNVTVRSIVLPRNGKLLLKSSVSILFSDNAACPYDREPLPEITVGQRNEFVGVKTNFWECPQNWLTEDNFPAQRPPCGEDSAIFEDEATYSFVVSNGSISVRSLTIRGETLGSLTPGDEFKLSVTVNPSCGINPSLCPCPSQDGCNAGPVVEPDGVQGGGGGGSVGGIAAGITIAIVAAVVAVLVGVIIGIVVYRKRKHKISYAKDELNEAEDDTHTYETVEHRSAKESLSFNNPFYGTPTDADDAGLVGHDILGEDEEGDDIPGDYKVDLGKTSPIV